jgi:hypothetical protein
MNWLKKMAFWYLKEEEKVFGPKKLRLKEKNPKSTKIASEEIDPNQVTVENAYKTRWIWYHTILAIGIFFTNCLLIAILLLLGIKL